MATIDRIKEKLAELPKRQREAFLLARLDGLSHEEIAAILSITAVEVRAHVVATINALVVTAREGSARILHSR